MGRSIFLLRSEAVSSAMSCEVHAMRIAKPVDGSCSIYTQCCQGGITQRRTHQWRPFVGEADETLVECCVPEGRKEKANVDIEPLLVAAVGPRHVVRGAQQRRLGDAAHHARGEGSSRPSPRRCRRSCRSFRAILPGSLEDQGGAGHRSVLRFRWSDRPLRRRRSVVE
jgi:hypothetical protein